MRKRNNYRLFKIINFTYLILELTEDGVRVCLIVGRKVKNWKVKGVKMESKGKLSNDEK